MSGDAAKQAADAAFRAGEYAEAVNLYTLALDSSPPPHHVLLSNRSAAALRCNDVAAAAADALDSLREEPCYAKGLYRLAQALLKAGWSAAAHAAFTLGAELNNGAEEMVAGVAEVRQPQSWLRRLGPTPVPG